MRPKRGGHSLDAVLQGLPRCQDDPYLPPQPAVAAVGREVAFRSARCGKDLDPKAGIGRQLGQKIQQLGAFHRGRPSGAAG